MGGGSTEGSFLLRILVAPPGNGGGASAPPGNGGEYRGDHFGYRGDTGGRAPPGFREATREP